MEDKETRRLNRHQAQTADKTSFWCSNCDRDKVTLYGSQRKCSVCGWRATRLSSNKKMIKQPV